MRDSSAASHFVQAGGFHTGITVRCKVCDPLLRAKGYACCSYRRRLLFPPCFLSSCARRSHHHSDCAVAVTHYLYVSLPLAVKPAPIERQTWDV